MLVELLKLQLNTTKAFKCCLRPLTTLKINIVIENWIWCCKRELDADKWINFLLGSQSFLFSDMDGWKKCHKSFRESFHELKQEHISIVHCTYDLRTPSSTFKDRRNDNLQKWWSLLNWFLWINFRMKACLKKVFKKARLSHLLSFVGDKTVENFLETCFFRPKA